MTTLRYGISAAGFWVRDTGQSEPRWYVHRRVLGAELTGSEAVLSVVYNMHGRTHFIMHRAGYTQTGHYTAVALARRYWAKHDGV